MNPIDLNRLLDYLANNTDKFELYANRLNEYCVDGEHKAIIDNVLMMLSIALKEN